MTKNSSTTLKAIRASRRVQGLEVSPKGGTGALGENKAGPSNSKPNLISTNKHQEEDNDHIKPDDNADGLGAQSEFKEKCQPDPFKEKRQPDPTQSQNYSNFIGNVPIPFPAETNPLFNATIRVPKGKERAEQSSSNIDDLAGDFVHEDYKLVGASDNLEVKDLEEHQASSPSLGSSNGEDGPDISSSSSDSDNGDSEEDSSSESESEDSEREVKKDKKRKRTSKLKKKLEDAKNEIKQLGKIANIKPSEAAKKSSRRAKKTSDKKKRSKKNGIQVNIGVISKSDLIQLQPFWRKQMKKLESSIPLTVFDQSFALADKEEYKRQHHLSSSKTSKNKGLEAQSEFKMTYGEWTENISLFKRYLIQHKQKEVAERLNFHIKNVKQVK
ncbi:uncharacterized protein MELLADRAFT_104290 [Melampsora larici-populina 98AG31]|uniref:Uncharacterized protein n=1 Tax=Melampsora larici-populina (strain 98AG31 / pathotype 3-4-7) TaxID=747676 RepID=F4RE80_MELLP|nr:uncharacterized protein MELLADRAFT_104290 [Melampsora larici-populina 98AG31]EGG09046.1 hypothetical protein MELLADRAFT_104290 [Melampsora larici-populina 98AG31]